MQRILYAWCIEQPCGGNSIASKELVQMAKNILEVPGENNYFLDMQTAEFKGNSKWLRNFKVNYNMKVRKRKKHDIKQLVQVCFIR